MEKEANVDGKICRGHPSISIASFFEVTKFVPARDYFIFKDIFIDTLKD